MNKAELIRQIQTHLAGELSGLLPEIEAASAQGTQVKPSTAERVNEIQQQLTQYRFLPTREFSNDDVICAGCLVELELQGRKAFYYLVPSGGGLVLSFDGNPVQIITPQSPLGEALLGKRLGDEVKVALRNQIREYKVTALI